SVDQISGALMRYISDDYDRTAQAGTGNYYCKVCHETISSAIFETDVHRVVMSEELRKAIYGEVMFELRFLRFQDVANTQQIVNATRDAIYPFVSEIERQILKSRTVSAEII